MEQKSSKFLLFLQGIDSFFQTNNAFGFDISDYSVEVLELKRSMGKIRLGAYGRVKLEKGIVEDGRIISTSRLKDKIEELLDSINFKPLRNTEIVVSLPESKIFLHIFELPANISYKNLGVAIESQALKTIPVDLTELYSDFQIVSKKRSTQKILYVAAYKEIVDSYLEVMGGGWSGANSFRHRVG